MRIRKLRPGLLLLVSAALASAQTHPNSLIITAWRPSTLQPDEIVFAVSVTSPLNTNLEDTVAALAGSGITADDLSSVSSVQVPVVSPDGSQNCVPGLQWVFTRGVPFSKMKDTTSLLTGIRQNIAQKIPGAVLDFGVQGARVSPQLQASQECPISDLIADARTQARQLASAAGASVGPILAVADQSVSAASGAFYLTTPIPFIGGNACTGSYSSTSASSLRSAPSCTIVVKFSLVPSQ